MIGILVDVTRCVGCNQCIDACVEANGLGAAEPAVQQVHDGLSADRYAAIVYSPEGHPVRKFCRHCIDPACVSVCPVGAMIKTDAGPVIYDASKCMGCRYCMMACPYGIPRYEWDSVAPTVRKCNLCADRVAGGEEPACTAACTEEALVFGPREKILVEARTRLQAEPNTYMAHIYGEREVGGTSVVYISDVSLDFLAYNGLSPEHPLPDLSWNWISKVPGISLATAGLMTGLFWVIGRRMQVEEARANGRKEA